MTHAELKQSLTEFQGFLKANGIKQLYSFTDHETNRANLKFAWKKKMFDVEVKINDSQFFYTTYTFKNKDGEIVSKVYNEYRSKTVCKYSMLKGILKRIEYTEFN